MKRCEKCGVEVRGERERCPLCQGLLLGEGEPGPFPLFLGAYQQYGLFFKLLLLVTVAACIGSLAVNYLFPDSGSWALFVVLGGVCLWLNLILVMRKRRNIPKTLVWEVFLVSLLCIFWDFYVGWRGWSVEFVVPILCMAAMATLAVTARIFHVPVGSLMVYLCIVALLGFFMLVLLLTGRLGILLPGVLCVSMSLLMLAALLIFRGRAMLTELRRRLHM